MEDQSAVAEASTIKRDTMKVTPHWTLECLQGFHAPTRLSMSSAVFDCFGVYIFGTGMEVQSHVVWVF